MNREDFNILNTGIIYLDNGATTLKPKCLVEATNDYYLNYSANAHRGDYSISLKVDKMYEEVRDKVKRLINCESNEVIFTSGCTDSLNKVVFGFCKNYLKEGDEILLTKAEHASNVLPWFELSEEIKTSVKYIPLTEDHMVTVDNVIKSITDKTKVISLAQVTNVIGDIRPIKEITKIAHERGIIVIVDGAQSVPHMKVDVKDLDIDFLAFSAHKMCGPTGVGVLFGKYNLLEKMKPTSFGGGMNSYFEVNFDREYSKIPTRFEAGTPNIAGVIAFGKVIDYLLNIGMDNISKHELSLKKYLIDRLKENKNITIYNENTMSGIVTFNYKDIFSQDLAIYLNKENICVRAGNHCAKILKEEIGVKNTCRVSLYLYNTKEEIDKLVDTLNCPTIKNNII